MMLLIAAHLYEQIREVIIESIDLFLDNLN